MSADLICPDCGGILGGDDSEGSPCTCFSSKSTLSPELAAEEHSSGDTFVEKTAVVGKVCCQCGKDLSGKKRLRDSRGYWCPECAKADKAANAPKGTKCADCGRVVNEAALTEYEGLKICGPCRIQRKQLEKEQRRLSPVKTNAYQEMDKRKLLGLLAVFGVLVLIIILRQFKLIGH
jgi:hypothetical protein